MKFENRRQGFRLSEIAYKLSGKKAVVETEVIRGRRLNIIFTFFNKPNFRAEYIDWKNYQNRIYNDKERIQQVEGFKLYKKIESRGGIEYGEFIRLTFSFFSRILFQVFSNNADLFLNSKNLTIQIKIEEQKDGNMIKRLRIHLRGLLPILTLLTIWKML